MNLHPEHPLNDPPVLSERSESKGPRYLPAPAPDNTAFYKWKDGLYLGYDWRNPLAAANYLKHQQRLEKQRAAKRKRYQSKPNPNRTNAGSLLFAGWKFLCPKCEKCVNLLYYPLPQLSLLHNELSDFLSDSSFDIVSDFGFSHSDFPQGFACKSCHNVKYTSRLSYKSWNEIITYLSAGLLFGHEVPRPDWFTYERKTKYAPKLNRDPSARRPQIEKLLLTGLSINDVAATLSLSKGTVLFYTKQIYPQHGVRSLRELYLKFGIPVRPGMRGAGLAKKGEGRQPRRRRKALAPL